MLPTTTVTILSENTAGLGTGILAEHGFSALIESPGLRLLFDTGAGYVLFNNAARLGAGLSRLDGVVLSHGHYDHTGGLPGVLALYPQGLPVYAHPEVFADKYSVRRREGEPDQRHYIGLPLARRALEESGARFDLGREPRQIAEGLWLSGEIPRRTDFEHVPGELVIRQGEQYLPDAMRDEQSLFLRGAHGVIVFLGCAHPGMINIIQHALAVTGLPRVQAVIGGTHLIGQGEAELSASVAALKRYDPLLVGTAHCTGLKANARIIGEFGSAFRECRAGTVLTLE